MNKEKILIVEDEAITALNISKILKKRNYDIVDIASTGEKAVELAEIHEPGLILMDIKLEGEIDGITASSMIKSRLNIPILYCTGHTDDMTISRVIKSNPNGYIVKPVKSNELHLAIEIAINNHEVEIKLKSSLKEKDILLSENHHRVKNNMQVMLSLLNLQSKKSEDRNGRSNCIKCENRIHSMALVHEKLYQAGDLSSINFGDYLNKLVDDVYILNSVSRNEISTDLNVNDIFLGLNKAIPCGLIISEIITDSINNKTPGGPCGEIHISIKNDKHGKYSLTISSDLIGFHENFQNEMQHPSDLKLIKLLVRQLRGEIEISGRNGEKLIISFY